MAKKEKAEFPGWYYGPNGEAQVFQSEDDVPKGWATTPEKATAPPAKKAAKPEHDL